VALGVFLLIVVGLLAFRGYANHLGARPTEPAKADLIDLNSADQSELSQVPGVGPKLAEAINDHRRVHGAFKSVDELKTVRGVGPITFEKIRNQFRVGTLPKQLTPAVEAPASPSHPPTAAPAPAPSPGPRSASSSKKIQPGERPINVNTASAEELQRLPSIGPVTAQAIIAKRTATPFQSLNDLDNVKGIGPKTLEKLRPFVVVK
jgi:competence protein ComEA